VVAEPTDATLASVESWMAQKQITLWGDFDISDEKGRRRAALWLVGQMWAWMQWREAQCQES